MAARFSGGRSRFVYPLAVGMKEIYIFLSLIKHKFWRKRTRKPAVSKLNVVQGICFILIVHIKMYLETEEYNISPDMYMLYHGGQI
jgi:hypothetical protein